MGNAPVLAVEDGLPVRAERFDEDVLDRLAIAEVVVALDEFIPQPGLLPMAFGYIAVGDFSSAESDKVLITLMLRTRCHFVCENT